MIVLVVLFYADARYLACFADEEGRNGLGLAAQRGNDSPGMIFLVLHYLEALWGF